MSYVRTFLPWIVYAIVPSKSWQWAAVAGLAVALALIVQQSRAGRTADALIIEISSAVFFAALAVVAFAAPDSGVHSYSAAISAGFLGLVAAVSLAVRKPFTLGIAKQTTPREFWDMPQFIRTNVIITAVWTAAFIVTSIVLAVIAKAGDAHSAGAVVVQVAGFVVPMLFTIRYVAAVQARAQAR